MIERLEELVSPILQFFGAVFYKPLLIAATWPLLLVEQTGTWIYPFAHFVMNFGFCVALLALEQILLRPQESGEVRRSYSLLGLFRPTPGRFFGAWVLSAITAAILVSGGSKPAGTGAVDILIKDIAVTESAITGHEPAGDKGTLETGR